MWLVLLLLYPVVAAAGWTHFFWFLPIPPALVFAWSYRRTLHAQSVMARTGIGAEARGRFALQLIPRVLLVAFWNFLLYGIAFAAGFALHAFSGLHE